MQSESESGCYEFERVELNNCKEVTNAFHWKGPSFSLVLIVEHNNKESIVNQSKCTWQ